MNSVMHAERLYPNWWARDPSQDERLKGLEELVDAINDAMQIACCPPDTDQWEPTGPPIQPLKLAALLRDAAERLERLTLEGS